MQGVAAPSHRLLLLHGSTGRDAPWPDKDGAVRGVSVYVDPTAVAHVLSQYKESVAVATDIAVTALLALGVPLAEILPPHLRPPLEEEDIRGSDTQG